MNYTEQSVFLTNVSAIEASRNRSNPA